MFEKKDCIYSEGIGVCKVDDIVNLSTDKKTPIKYYLLRSLFDKEKVSYIPVDEHKVELRKILTLEEAKKKSTQEKLSLNERKEIEYVFKINK